MSKITISEAAQQYIAERTDVAGREKKHALIFLQMF